MLAICLQLAVVKERFTLGAYWRVCAPRLTQCKRPLSVSFVTDGCRAELLTPDFSRVRVLIGHTGHVHWEPGGVFTTTCDIDVRYFPFDDQRCMIEFGAWAYYSARVNITSASDTVSVRPLSFF